MQRSRLRLTIYLTAAGLAVGGGTLAAVAATSPAKGGLTATFTKDSDWGTGYEGHFTIRNTGGSAVTGWQVAFGMPSTAKIGAFWDSTITTSGSTATATNRGYNATIRAGGSLEFGFIVAGQGNPTSCTINGASCTGGGGSNTPTKAPTTKPAPNPPKPPNNPNPPAPPKPPATTKPPAPNNPAPPPPPAGNSNVLVAPYADMGLVSNGSTTLQALAKGAGVKSMSLAFVNSAGCKASWFGAFDPRSKQFADQIAAIRAGGGDVKVSFGGATGIELAQACTSDAALLAEYQAVVSAYNLKFIDMDIEGAAVADKVTIARRSKALKALQDANPGLKISLTLPVLPEGLTADGKNVVSSARDAGVKVDLVNIMAMDYGRAGQDYGDLAIQAVKSTKDQVKAIFQVSDAAAFRMVGVTPMLGKNDDQGTFDLSDARDLVNFANDNHVGYMSYWEANRDQNACNGALFQCTNVPQTAFQFGRIFAGFRG